MSHINPAGHRRPPCERQHDSISWLLPGFLQGWRKTSRLLGPLRWKGKGGWRRWSVTRTGWKGIFLSKYWIVSIKRRQSRGPCSWLGLAKAQCFQPCYTHVNTPAELLPQGNSHQPPEWDQWKEWKYLAPKDYIRQWVGEGEKRRLWRERDMGGEDWEEGRTSGSAALSGCRYRCYFVPEP